MSTPNFFFSLANISAQHFRALNISNNTPDISSPKEPVLPILVFTNVDMCAIFTWDENAIAVSVPPLIFFIRLVSFIVPVAIEKITLNPVADLYIINLNEGKHSILKIVIENTDFGSNDVNYKHHVM
ncbi:4575_t:CDS:2 [Cetraspora pellucida]|uniref:4575_t:CDS:1 n=1 Tax=Cetraspora pellucida TaxID=1433469 RepID=A0A9N8W9C0_9GLOM|nr:4575_t:CDS:2 [Cetraspora pellucida]